MKKLFIRIGIIVVLVVVIALLGSLAWVNANTYEPDAVALTSWERAEKGDGWYAFFPTDGIADEVGVIFYTGGLVDSRAYAVMAEALARETDVLVVVPEVPLNLVILNPTLANDVMPDFPQVERWILGGHSLGATGAAVYADSHPDVAGLFFWAGGSWEPNDLSDTTIPIISVHGSEDGIYTEEEWAASRPFAPADTEYVSIIGGNHSSFGNYGLQSGDTVPILPQAVPQADIIRATSDFILKQKER
jgi:hypothetical protein